MSQMVQSHSIYSAVLSVPCYPSPYSTQVPQTPLPSQQKLLNTNPASQPTTAVNHSSLVKTAMEWVATQLTADFSKRHNGMFLEEIENDNFE